MHMLKYYFTIAIRNAMRSKLYSAISLGGLSLGLFASLMIGIYVNDELSYDSWIPDAENIYRVAPMFSGGRARASPSDLGLWLRQDYPQIKEVTRIFNGNHRLEKENNNYNETIRWVDQNFFSVFELAVAEGTLDGALADPGSLVISEEVARKYFPASSAIGQILLLDGEQPMRVSAVIRDLPSNSHMSIDVLGPGHALSSALLTQDQNPVQGYFGAKVWGTQTYIRVDPEVSVAAIQEDLGPLMDRHLPISDGRPNSEIYELEILPIEAIHLAPANQAEGQQDFSGVLTVAAIAVLILLAASTNYINLMTARGMKRAPEIAIRKTVGANRSNLIMQFLTESSLFVVVSFLLAIAFCAVALEPFNSFLEREIEFSRFFEYHLILASAGLILTTVLFAGLYPALTLSRFSPLHTFRTLKIQARGFFRNGAVRQVLSVLQFAILTGLMIAGYTLYRQSQFGIQEALQQLEDPVVILTSSCDEPLKQALTQIPQVRATACTALVPQWGMGATASMSPSSDSTRRVITAYASADVGMFELLGMELAAGRLFEEERSADILRDFGQFDTTTSVVVNETFVRQMELGSPLDAVGQTLRWSRLYQRPSTFAPIHEVEIIGVLEDFQIGNVRRESPAAAFFVQPDQNSRILIKIDGQNIVPALAAIDGLWAEMNPDLPVRRLFFDETVESMYQELTRQASLLSVAVLVAIGIAILGLIGLAAFMAEKRTKEIGIRKVLGASRLNIMSLLLWQFSKPVLISNLIAWPLAYYYLTVWLQGFARHIELSPLSFLVAGLLTFIIAIATVMAHAFFMAGTKPITALRYE